MSRKMCPSLGAYMDNARENTPWNILFFPLPLLALTGLACVSRSLSACPEVPIPGPFPALALQGKMNYITARPNMPSQSFVVLAHVPLPAL